MSRNFYANQFERSFHPQRLGNWQVPKKYPLDIPRARRGHTRVIADDRGHLLPGVPRIEPWNHFTSTWQLPKRISRKVAKDINTLRPTGKHLTSWEKRSYHVPIYDRNVPPTLPSTEKEKRKSSIKREIPVIEDREEEDEEVLKDAIKQDEHHHSPSMGSDGTAEDVDSKKGVGDNFQSDCEALQPSSPIKKLDMNGSSPPRSSKASRSGSGVSKIQKEDEVADIFDNDYLSPHYAKELAQDNLKHQPLPDTVTHRAYKALQMKKETSPGLAIADIPTKAAAIGTQKYVSPGPTQCSKMMVYRPKTAGQEPTSYEPLIEPPKFSKKKDLGPIDLAICWDLVLDKSNEPKKPIHIDGSTDTAGPSVFTMVKRPQSSTQASPQGSRNHSASKRKEKKNGDRRDRTVLGLKKEYDDKPTNPSAVMDIINNNLDAADKIGEVKSLLPKRNSSQGSENSARKTSNIRKSSATSSRVSLGSLENRNPNIPIESKEDQIANTCVGSHCGTEKNSHIGGGSIKDIAKASFDSSFDSEKMSRMKHYRSSPNLSLVGEDNGRNKQKGLFSRLCMACDSKAPNECERRLKSDYKMAFKAGVPNNLGHHCKLESPGTRPHTAKPLSIPKPRTPYAKRSYSINTLAPPFALWPGTTGMDYPEHWRLASVYQHSFKPMEHRKRPLLRSVYH